MSGKSGLGKASKDYPFDGLNSDPSGFGERNYFGGTTTHAKWTDARDNKYASELGLPYALARVLDEAEELLLAKHEDYGPDNINKSPFGPLFGLLVRMYDKQARAAHLVSTGADANYESLEDTFLDMLNYSAIAILVLRKQWPQS